MCPALVDPDNGQVTFNDTSVGDMAIFTCNDGFVLVGARKLTCLDGGLVGGMWDNRAPVCIREFSGDNF